MYALDFEVTGRNQILTVRFWKENTLVRVPLFRCPLVAGFPSTFFQTWPCQCVRLSCFPGPNLGQLWLVFARGSIPIQVRRAVSADPDAQGGRKRLRGDGLLLTTAVFDRVP